MKKIIFYTIENSNDNPDNIFLKENKNSLISYETNKFYFTSHFTKDKEEIEVKKEIIVFGENIYEKLCMIKNAAIKEASCISEEKIEVEKEEGSINAIIHSEIFKSYYVNPNSIFDFIGNIFIKILMGHKLENGNKRVALLFLIGSLKYFGYHFDWSEGLKQNYSAYKAEVEKFVELLQNKTYENKNEFNLKTKIEKMYNKCINEVSKEEIKNFIFKWIKNHSTIALYWR